MAQGQSDRAKQAVTEREKSLAGPHHSFCSHCFQSILMPAVFTTSDQRADSDAI